MKLTSILQCSLLTAIAISSTSAFSANTNSSVTHEPTKQITTNAKNIQIFEKSFSFDWKNQSTIALNKDKVEKTEEFVKKFYDYTDLSFSDRQSLGSLLFKLGTFYAHVSHKPDLALEKMKLADMLLITKQEKAWNNNHIAYAYEQKYARSGKTADKQNAFDYINIVLTELYPNTINKEVAFAYGVRGMIFNDAKDFEHAEANYKIALSMYEQCPDGKDEQYFRIKNQLASVMLEQNNQNHEALAMLEQVKKYWQSKGHENHNPYAANNLMAMGQAHLQMGNSKMACNEINKAIQIYKNVYGKDNAMLAMPYQLLANAYKEQKNIKLASLYAEKADQFQA